MFGRDNYLDHVLARKTNECRSSVGSDGLRNAIDGLQNARDDLVRITFGVRAAIFQIAPVTVLDEVNGHPDGSATIGEAVAELVNGLRFVQTCQSQMVIRAIHGDVLWDVSFERLHEGFKVVLASNVAEVFK